MVNNVCSDDASSVVASFAERLPVRETLEPEPGLSAALNRALLDSKGSHIAFIDDDILVTEGWLTTFARLIESYPEGAVFARPVQAYCPVTPDLDLMALSPFLQKGFCELNHKQPEGPLADGLLSVGANVAFGKAALDGFRFDTRLVRDGTRMAATKTWSSCVGCWPKEILPFGRRSCRYSTTSTPCV